MPIVQQQLNKLLDGLSASITQQELDAAAKQLISGLKPLEQDPFQRSWFYSRYLIHGYGIEALLDVEQTAQSIDLEYMQQRAKWAFGDSAKQMDATLTPAQ
ncbi:probable zinc protease PqqL [Vibrio ponticus]|nr:probable zinc protease PqqL [Vibrio ponticus]